MRDDLLLKTQPAQNVFFAANKEKLKTVVTHGQKPQALFIGCSDSRVVPEQMLGLEPGDIFMLRNIANTVPPYVQTEIGIISVLEFAILTLKVPRIIVCGHTDCGGIRGLDMHIDMGTSPALSRWLDIVRPAQRDVDFTMRDLTPEERHIAIVERHVINQLHNIESYPFIRHALTSGQLTLHGWVFYLEQQRLGYYDSELDSYKRL